MKDIAVHHFTPFVSRWQAVSAAQLDVERSNIITVTSLGMIGWARNKTQSRIALLNAPLGINNEKK